MNKFIIINNMLAKLEIERNESERIATLAKLKHELNKLKGEYAAILDRFSLLTETIRDVYHVDITKFFNVTNP